MADAVKINVEKKVEIQGQTRAESVLFSACPEAHQIAQAPTFKRIMEPDPRKWDQKPIEDNMHAVARHDFKHCASMLSGPEQDVLKARPKDCQNGKLVRKEKAELDTPARGSRQPPRRWTPRRVRHCKMSAR